MTHDDPSTPHRPTPRQPTLPPTPRRQRKLVSNSVPFQINRPRVTETRRLLWAQTDLHLPRAEGHSAARSVPVDVTNWLDKLMLIAAKMPECEGGQIKPGLL